MRLISVPLSMVQPGITLSSPVHDDRGDRSTLLIAQGVEISADLLERLKSRGVSTVRLTERDWGRLTGTSDGDGDTGHSPLVVAARLHREDALSHRLKQPDAVDYSRSDLAACQAMLNRSIDFAGDLFRDLGRGFSLDQQESQNLSREHIVALTRDLDLYAAVGTGHAGNRYPQQHGVQVMMLAMSMGAHTGFSETELIELGMGSLAHDAGMLMLPDTVWQEPRRLSDLEKLQVSRHPAMIFERLSASPHVSTGVRMVAFQMHERFNGSGYPRGRKAAQIHPLARVAAVADVYIALVSARPYRRAMLPYLAVEQLIRQSHQGLFDPAAVRALLQTVSLFPLGSCVVATDGRIGRVLRANGDEFTRPVVKLWNREASEDQAEIVDLSSDFETAIRRPLTVFEAGELGMLEPVPSAESLASA